MELLENFMWKPRGFRETRVFESHGSWPSQASACGRAALGRLAHPLVGVLSKKQWQQGEAVKPGLDWSLDSGLDWTMDWTLDWTGLEEVWVATFGYRLETEK